METLSIETRDIDEDQAKKDADSSSYLEKVREYQRILKLAQDVNGEGNICCRIFKAKGEWVYEVCLGIESVDILFTLEGAKEACEILNEGDLAAIGVKNEKG